MHLAKANIDRTRTCDKKLKSIVCYRHCHKNNPTSPENKRIEHVLGNNQHNKDKNLWQQLNGPYNGKKRSDKHLKHEGI